jgi:hypothetical protein
MLARVYGIPIREFLCSALVPWAARVVPLLAAAGWIGMRLSGAPWTVVAAVVAGLLGGYVVAVRSLAERVPWPDRVRAWLNRLRLTRPSSASAQP